MHRRALQQYITSTPEDRQFYQQHQNDEQCGGMKDLFFQKPHWSVYTDVHVVTAFFIAGCRLGINLGELIDFLLGWSGADIIGDDL